MASAIATALISGCVAVVSGASYFASPVRLRRNFRITQRITPSYHLRQVYQDQDGEAASASAGPSLDRLSRILIPFIAFGTLSLSASILVLLDFETRLCIITSGWIIVNVDVIFLSRETAQTKRFAIGLLVALSSLALTVALVIDIYTAATIHERQDATYLMVETIKWAQLAFGVCLSLACVSLSRGPTLFIDNQAVDAQFTCSAIARFTFAWARPLLDQARKSRWVEYSDLPVLDHSTRSRNLKDRFSTGDTGYSGQNPLWKALLRDHYTVFVRQWMLAILESIVMMLPLVCLYKVLSLLEQRSPDNTTNDDVEVWLWVSCLAVSKLLHVVLENWFVFRLQWLSFAILATPIRSQLSALIFAKSLRMKIIEGTSASGQRATPRTHRRSIDDDGGDNDAHEMDTFLPDSENDVGNNSEDANEKDDAAARGIVNLLAVDVQRVSDFSGNSVDLLRGLVKTVLATGFLIALLGWWSTLAGLAVPIALQPLNRVATKFYTSKQLLVMSARDEKAHVVTEALHGIRQIKFSAIEAQWERVILAARERELRAQWSVYVWAIFLMFCWIAMPTLIGAAALSVYAWISQHMVASVAFTALSVFSSLEWTISAVPTTITEMLDARVSADRIQQHLNSEESARILQPGELVVFKDATIAWPSSFQSPQDFALRGLNLSFPHGQLSVIHGKTGVGKSLLLAAIIGEADVLAGQISVPQSPPGNVRYSKHVPVKDWILPSAFAYVAQVPWIENASVKDTILYGTPYRRDRYMQVLHACALDDDIKMLPDGENTEVGATGINLSGGQRWRLTFARALYSRAGILVMDDIFSAVDTHVGRHLLEHGITGRLGVGRTVILVTHHIGLVERYASYVVNIGEDGTSADARETQAESLRTAPDSMSNDHLLQSDSEDANTPGRNQFKDVDLVKSQARKFVEDETRQQGRVKLSVYKTYILASGGRLYWALTFILFAVAALAVVGRSYWLAIWTEAYTVQDSRSSTLQGPPNQESPSEPHLVFYLTIYIGISLFSVALVCIKTIFVLVASLRAARHLFEAATFNVLRAQLRWLDTEPVGRILNRFVGDFALIDSRLGGDVMWCANGVFSIATIVTAALFVSLWMTLPVAMLSLTCLYVVYLYLDGARDIKRLESNARSPIFELVGSALSGLATIRNFGRVDDYLSRMYASIDKYTQASWYILLTTRWMAFRQGILGVFFTLCIAFAVAYLPNVGASLAGFALSFALDFSAVTESTITRYTSMELDMNSAERVMEYMDLTTESRSGAEVTTAWPAHGKVEVSALEVGYASDLDSVLKGVSFVVEPCQRIGIVGRTGSGKSSLTLSLFRFLEARKGSIKVDGVDIATLKLHDLRSRLSIIPQDPVLFSGTLRSNLDPFEEHSDSDLLKALRRVSLLDADGPDGSVDNAKSISRKASVFESLSSPITRGGSNLSQGEKQLLCLARAIITRPKILILDEATSAVDMETDALIQRSIREEFRNSTLLVVAHRLSTIADFDKVLVLSDGKVVEYDRPEVLVQNHGAFWRMLNDSGEKEALRDLLS